MTITQRLVAIVVCGALAVFFWNLQSAEPGTWMHDIGLAIACVLLVIAGICFLPFAARTMAEEETIECPECEGNGETQEGRYVRIGGVDVLTYRCGRCDGDGTCSNGQFTAGAGCGCLCLIMILLGITAGMNRISQLWGGTEDAPKGDPPPKVAPATNPADKPTKPSPAIAEKNPPATPSIDPKPSPPMPPPMTPEKKPVVVTPPEKNPRVRTWTTADGKFTVEAEFRSMTGGVVKLKRVDNGQEVSIPLEGLSPQDQQWLRDFRLSR